MQNLGREFRLQADSARGIVDRFDLAVIALRHLKFRGRKLRPGPLLNAIVLQFLRMDEAEREAFSSKALADLERLLGDPPAEQSPRRPAESPPPNIVVTLERPRPKGRARKRGGGHTDGEEMGGGGTAGAGGGRGVG